MTDATTLDRDELKALLLDACKVLDHYGLPEQAFYYRRKVLGDDEAIRIGREKAGVR